MIEILVSLKDGKITSLQEMIARDFRNPMNDLWDDGDLYPDEVEVEFADELRYIDNRLTNVYGLGFVPQCNEFVISIGDEKINYFRCYLLETQKSLLIYLNERPDIEIGRTVSIKAKRYVPRHIDTLSDSMCSSSGEKQNVVEKFSDYVWMIVDYMKG